MKKFNYFPFIAFILFSLIQSCSYFKDGKKDAERTGTYFVETVAKPDPSLRGIKVYLPKPLVNKTWSQLTNNEAHKVKHPLVGKKIKLAWKTSIGKGQNKKRPTSSQPVIDKDNVYTLDTELRITASFLPSLK